jgi:hypothetical protein
LRQMYRPGKARGIGPPHRRNANRRGVGEEEVGNMSDSDTKDARVKGKPACARWVRSAVRFDRITRAVQLPSDRPPYD